MRFYRVETSAGTGPYASTVPVDGGANIRHPAPFKDGIPMVLPKEYRYGFRTLKQYREWFDKNERATLRKYHFRLAVYDVTDVHNGGRQSAAIFDQNDLIEIRRI